MTRERPVYVVTGYMLHVGHSQPMAAFSSKASAEKWMSEQPDASVDEFRVTKLLPNQFKAKGT